MFHVGFVSELVMGKDKERACLIVSALMGTAARVDKEDYPRSSKGTGLKECVVRHYLMSLCR
jgi:hypothetical protein